MRLIAQIFAVTLALLLTAPVAQADPNFWKFEWPETDFSRTSVPWIEVLSGGPPKDGIPALDDPAFAPASATTLAASEPVITLELPGAPARAYPLRYLIWHEIVNDMIGDVPVAVTFCPLCNSAIVFDRRVEMKVLSFGVSGKLRHSDMIMYDRETQSWWQQAVGQAIVGDMLGHDLITLPSWTEPVSTFVAAHPDGQIMVEPDWPRAYGTNPYARYDSAARPFLYSGETPPYDIPPLLRVVRVGDAAWPLDRLRAAGQMTEAGVTLSWGAGMASALDTTQIAQGRDIGFIRVRDEQGRDLPHDVMFAFAFHAFYPQGRWMLR